MEKVREALRPAASVPVNVTVYVASDGKLQLVKVKVREAASNESHVIALSPAME